MPALPLDQSIPAGTLVSIPLSFYSLTLVTRPATGDIVAACSGLNHFSATSFSYDLTSGIGSERGVLYGAVEADSNGYDSIGTDVLNEIKSTLSNHFHSLVGLNVGELDSASSTQGNTIIDSLGNVIDSAGHIITDAAKAAEEKAAAAAKNVEQFMIIALVLAVAAIFFLSKAKNIHIGI